MITLTGKLLQNWIELLRLDFGSGRLVIISMDRPVLNQGFLPPTLHCLFEFFAEPDGVVAVNIHEKSRQESRVRESRPAPRPHHRASKRRGNTLAADQVQIVVLQPEGLTYYPVAAQSVMLLHVILCEKRLV